MLRMSDKAQNEIIDGKKKFTRKAGKTLLIKAKDGYTVKDEWFNSLDGLVEDGIAKTAKTGSYFLTFETIDKSLHALKHIQKEHDEELMVKFAHYRVFFTMEGLDESIDYNTVKEKHVDFVTKHTGSEVLYYKLYRNKTYIGCGDLTIDTKDALDKLLSSDHNKQFDLGDGQVGTFYRYNKNGKETDGNVEHAHTGTAQVGTA